MLTALDGFKQMAADRQQQEGQEVSEWWAVREELAVGRKG